MSKTSLLYLGTLAFLSLPAGRLCLSASSPPSLSLPVFLRLFSALMGGHGGLNILPQKSWNVYNRSNRRRVEQDEAAAAVAAEEAEREVRTSATAASLQLLRQRAEARLEEGSSSTTMLDAHVSTGVLRRFNLFEKEERAACNAEAVAEARRSEARAVARVMPDLELGRSSKERRPWYARPVPPERGQEGFGTQGTSALMPTRSLQTSRLKASASSAEESSHLLQAPPISLTGRAIESLSLIHI